MRYFFTIEENQEKVRLLKKKGIKNKVYATYLKQEYAFEVSGMSVEPPPEALDMEEKILKKIIRKIKQFYTNAPLDDF